MRKRLRLLWLTWLLSILLISCSSALVEEARDAEVHEELTKPSRVSVWNVYWDHDNMEKEMEVLKDHIDEICYFAAYFDSDNSLFIPQEVTNNFDRVKKGFNNGEGYTHYLSIVNDKINLDGTSTLKDTELLYSLFLDENKLESHINEIITMALEGGYDGIEIDYERMKADKKLWELFIDYCERLHEGLKDKNLKMRVVLEPSFPGDDLDFPLGPDYIMMCYNLYGLGTKPGPKADQAFIIELVEKMQPLPGEKGFAFATGGFDWAENGEVTAVTEQEAIERMDAYGATPTRDEKSQCLYYEYVDADQLGHELWFADGETLSFWVETVKEMGDYNIALWRLNGNGGESLQEFISDIIS